MPDILFTRVDLCFSVHKLEMFLSNIGKVNFEGLVHLLKYIRDINILGLRYYDTIEDATSYELFRQTRIKTDNQLMVFSDSIWKECPYTGRSIGSYIVFYQDGPIYHCTHVPGPVAQSSAES